MPSPLSDSLPGPAPQFVRPWSPDCDYNWMAVTIHPPSDSEWPSVHFVTLSLATGQHCPWSDVVTQICCGCNLFKWDKIFSHLSLSAKCLSTVENFQKHPTFVLFPRIVSLTCQHLKESLLVWISDPVDVSIKLAPIQLSGCNQPSEPVLGDKGGVWT